MVVRSSTRSSKNIRSALLLKGTVVSKTTIKRRLTDEFGLIAYKPAKKPRLTPSMKAKRYACTKAHMDWTTENYRKFLFSDESTVQQFTSRKQLVGKPVGTRYEDRYTIQIMKHPLHHGLGTNVCACLYFLQSGNTMMAQNT